MKKILLIVAAMFAGACANTLEGGGASHKFYAALSSYDAAKIHAVEFVRSPAVTVETAERVLGVVQDSDAVIGEIVEEVRVNGVPSNGWEAADLVVRQAILRLDRLVDLDASGGVL